MTKSAYAKNKQDIILMKITYMNVGSVIVK